LLQLWRFFGPAVMGTGTSPAFGLLDVLLPLLAVLAVLVILHLFITLLLPLRWAKIRAEFARQLVLRVRQELETSYAPLAEDLAAKLLEERTQVEKLAGEVREVAGWLRQREQS